MRASAFLFLVLFFTSQLVLAQAAGLTSSPARLYYRLPIGATGSQKVQVSNPNSKVLEVGVSLGDWEYDRLGNNRLLDPETLKNSCAGWIKVLPGSYFTLMPNENKELTINLTVPPSVDKTIPVHTAMIYLSQLNPGNMTTGTGAALKVSVRMGVKVYHSFTLEDERSIEVVDFMDKKETVKSTSNGKSMQLSLLEINLENTGKIWLEGTITWELINVGTGEKIKIKDQDFYSLPGDKRTIRKELPDDLKKGKYSATAIINYGSKDELKVIELEFDH
jgi:hypothetical protein